MPASYFPAREFSAQRSSNSPIRFSQGEVLAAVLKLHGSARGRNVLRDLLTFMDGDALSLDAGNQRAVVTLLMACWNGLPMMTRDCIRESIEIPGASIEGGAL